MAVLELVDNVVKISVEALGLNFFKSLWSRDKTTTKTKAYKDISYVYYFCDFKSPYFKYPPDQREDLIKETVLEDKTFKVDKEILHAIEGYNKINKTPAMEFLEAASIALSNMKSFLISKDIDIDTLQKVIINSPKMISALNEATINAQKEQSGTTRVRGDQSTSGLEDGSI